MVGWWIEAAGWVFLAGIATVLASALPAARAHRGRLMGGGFLLAVASLGMVLLGWWLQRPS